MRKQHFGDAYDVVKQSLLRWLSKYGEWVVHPMFTEDYEADGIDQESKNFPDAFEQFLGVRLISRRPVLGLNKRSKSFRCVLEQPDVNVFLDPDKGLCLFGSPSRAHLSAEEFLRIAKARPNKLVMVFDQSFGFNEDRIEQLKAKLLQLEKSGVQGLAYRAQACFIIASCGVPMEELLAHLISESKLPRDRFLPAAGRSGASRIAVAGKA